VASEGLPSGTREKDRPRAAVAKPQSRNRGGSYAASPCGWLSSRDISSALFERGSRLGMRWHPPKLTVERRLCSLTRYRKVPTEATTGFLGCGRVCAGDR